MSATRQYLTNTAAQALGRTASFTVGFLVFVLIARFLGTESFGRFSYVLALLSLFVALAEFGTNGVLARGIVHQAPEKAPSYWGNFLLRRVGLAFLAMAAAGITAIFISSELSGLLLLGALALPALSSRFFEPIYQVFSRPWYSAYASLGYSLFYLLAVVAVLQLNGDLWSVYGAYLSANFVYTLLALVLALRLLKPRFRPDAQILGSIFRLAFPIGLAAFFVMVNTRADVIMIAHLMTDEAVGIYNSAFRFLELTALFAVVLANPTIPIFSHLAIENRSALRLTVTTAIESIAVIVLPVIIVIPLVSPWLVLFLFGETYAGAAPIMNILAWAGWLTFYSVLSFAVCVAIGVVHFAYWSAALAAAINILLNLHLIPVYGLLGAAWATVVSEIILLGIALIFITRHLGSVLRATVWARMLIPAGTFAAIVHLSGLHPAAGILLGIIIYGVLVVGLGLSPLAGWYTLRNSRRATGKE